MSERTPAAVPGAKPLRLSCLCPPPVQRRRTVRPYLCGGGECIPTPTVAQDIERTPDQREHLAPSPPERGIAQAIPWLVSGSALIGRGLHRRSK
jgi:hypothetical protein